MQLTKLVKNRFPKFSYTFHLDKVVVANCELSTNRRKNKLSNKR